VALKEPELEPKPSCCYHFFKERKSEALVLQREVKTINYGGKSVFIQ
jgi:hypothetical protein